MILDSRTEESPPILFLQMGGTIDKEYPQKPKTRHFEIGFRTASRQILEKVQVRFKHDFISICKKDSFDITDTDRKELLYCIQKVTLVVSEEIGGFIYFSRIQQQNSSSRTVLIQC